MQGNRANSQQLQGRLPRRGIRVVEEGGRRERGGREGEVAGFRAVFGSFTCKKLLAEKEKSFKSIF